VKRKLFRFGVMKWGGYAEISIRPCKESDAGICVFAYYNAKTPPGREWGDRELYGRFHLGIGFGRFLFEFRSKGGFHYCNYFATGVGG